MKQVFFVLLLTICLGWMGSLYGQNIPPDSDPKLSGSAKFTIPQSAIDAEIDGKVQIAILVEENGKPKRAVMSLGPMWPCSTTPIKALEELGEALIEMGMGLSFSPAIKKGKPASAVVTITLDLKNPRLTPPPKIDPVTGKPLANLITGGVINGKAIEMARPVYPAEAKANRDGGAVTVQILVGEDGSILRAGATSGAGTLQYAARDAACRSKFKPTLLAGHPVKVSGFITYNFVP